MSKAKAGANAGNKTFGELNGAEKLKFLGKVVVFVATFGFVFPTLFGD